MAVLDDAGVVLDADEAAALVIDGGAAVAVETDAGAIDDEDIQIDPAVAENPDINAGILAPPEDEDDDAPKSEEEIEKREPSAPVPQLARTV